MNLTVNPVLDRELKERVRGRRAAVVITSYLTLCSLLVYAVYWSETRRTNNDFFNGNINPVSSARTGRLMFDWLLIVVLLLTSYIVPGLTAAGIAGERDRQTLIPLQVTLLRPRSIVTGKLLAALSFLGLLLVATVPLMAVTSILGGVTLGMIVKGVAMVIVTGIVLGSMSLACSSLFRRVQGATVASYALTLTLLLGTFVAYGALRIFADRTGRSGPTVHSLITFPLWANPLVATADAHTSGGTTGGSSPLSSMARSVRQQGAIDPGFFPGGVRSNSNGPPVWLGSLGIYATLTSLSIVVASRRLRAPTEVDR